MSVIGFEVPGSREVKATADPNSQIGWTMGPFAGNATGARELAAYLTQAASDVFYLAPRRIEQGSRFLRGASELRSDASDLTDVLFSLQHNDVDRFEQLENIIRSAFPDIRRISVRHDASQSSSLNGEPVIYFTGRPQPIPLQTCGTGLEQMVAVAIAVLTAPSPRLFLIDEPQAYLHPHAERSLLKLLEDHPEHQYVLATHSNVLLRASSLSKVRLIYLEDGHSRITSVDDEHDLLDEIGVTAADLWLADRILWVEGPTEEEVIGLIADRTLAPAERLGLIVKRMPNSVARFATKRQASMDAAYSFCAESLAAVAPLPIMTHFLFDSDEKTDDFKGRINRTSGNNVTFLPVRELENLFLAPEVLWKQLVALVEPDQAGSITVDAVASSLASLLADTANTDLYPAGPPELGGEAAAVRGSRVLSKLWWEFAATAYDKVVNGRAIAEIALREKPELVGPLAELIGPGGPLARRASHGSS